MKNRESWSREIFFVLACVGAAAGLGNLWRFPYMAFENGGGAFLIPYIICLFLFGMPLMFLEIGAGVWSRGSLPAAAKKAKSRLSFVGWWALINSLVIVFYYSVVLAWCVRYFIYSFSLKWGGAPDEFLFQEVLNLTASPLEWGSLQLGTLIALIVIWLVIYWIVSSDIKRLSKVLIFTVPIPILLLVIMAANSVTLEGALDGLNALLQPRYGDILNTGVWAAAASQVVLSLGIGMGQIVAYASRKKNSKNVLKSGISICGLDLLVSLLAALVVFSTMGFLAFSMGVGFEDLQLESLPLVFISYPMALNNLPFSSWAIIAFGLMFFSTLILLGIDSAFAVIEANLAAFEERFGEFKRNTLALYLCLSCLFGGVIFSFGSGLYWLDIVDHWVANYAIATIIILQCILFTRSGVFDKIWKPIQEHFTWTYQPARVVLRFILPVVFIGIFGTQMIDEFFSPYGDYPTTAILIGGWLVTAIALMLGILLNRKWKN